MLLATKRTVEAQFTVLAPILRSKLEMAKLKSNLSFFVHTGINAFADQMGQHKLQII